MKGFFRNVSPRRAVLDLWQVLGAPSEYRTRALILAGLVTGGIFYTMVLQEGRALPLPPKIIYIDSWRADRSDAEIIAGNIAAQKKADAEAADEEMHQENIRKMYKSVGAATGIDTQQMYDQGTRDIAAAKKAQAEQNAALYRKITGHDVPAASAVLKPESTPSSAPSAPANHAAKPAGN